MRTNQKAIKNDFDHHFSSIFEAGPAFSVKKIYNNQNPISHKKLPNKMRIVYIIFGKNVPFVGNFYPEILLLFLVILS